MANIQIKDVVIGGERVQRTETDLDAVLNILRDVKDWKQEHSYILTKDSRVMELRESGVLAALLPWTDFIGRTDVVIIKGKALSILADNNVLFPDSISSKHSHIER
jgi:hypothetical protein